MNETVVTTCYRFTRLDNDVVAHLKAEMEAYSVPRALRGLVLIGQEGINFTVSGDQNAIDGFKALLAKCLGSDLHFKDSVTTKHPFHCFKVKVKDEIVTLGRPGLAPESPVNAHLTPTEWHEALKDPAAVVIDTRNDYEVDIGKFKSAIDFRLKEFREFPEALRQAQVPKEAPVLIYCTGGIRCEKAILEMNEQGYQNVRQLSGGILNYLKEFPEQEFNGECFVFDYRVAVDQNLQPTSKYKLCPHCGQPANQPLSCGQCGTETVICRACETAGILACSKNCEHHMAIGSGSRKPHGPELNKRHRL